MSDQINTDAYDLFAWPVRRPTQKWILRMRSGQGSWLGTLLLDHCPTEEEIERLRIIARLEKT